MNLCHLRQNIGIVTQKPILFNSSIKDNIAYGVANREVSMDEIIDVAKKANIHSFITTLAQVNHHQYFDATHFLNLKSNSYF